jgi:hypothetical protein
VIAFVADRISLVAFATYGLGIFIGIVSSYLAISRHLKL